VYGAAIQRPSWDVFSFFNGLSVLLAVVVLGVTSVGSAVGAGLFLGGPTLANLVPSLSQLSATSIALAGIGLGGNPNGILPSVGPALGGTLRHGKVRFTVLTAAAAAATYALDLAGVVGNWVFTEVLLAVLVAWIVAAVSGGGAAPPAPGHPRADGLSGAPGLLGLRPAFAASDRQVLDRQLGLPERPKPALVGAEPEDRAPGGTGGA
jgi:branched-chain amino acid transport system permease protein